MFDVLGEVFEGTSLKDLLIRAIRYGDQPEVRARLTRQIDSALDHDHLKSLLNRNALAQETMSAERLFAVKDEMEKAEARRLQPYFVRAFFLKAFEQLGGSMYPREAARFKVTHVDDTLLLIEPEAARQYEASVKKPDTGGATGTGSVSTISGGAAGAGPAGGGQTGTGSASGTGTTGSGDTTGTGGTTGAKAKSFHGSVQISPSTAKMRLVQVAEEIISVLAGDPNASLDVTVEINAEFPSGVSDQIKRAVSENAMSLGFKTKDWE